MFSVAGALSIALLAVAGLAFLVAVVLVLRALGTRSSIGKQPYDVGLVEAKRNTQAQMLAAGIVFVVGLIFLGAFAVIPRGEAAAENVAPPSVPVLPTPEVEMGLTPVATRTLAGPAVATIAPAATLPPPTPTIGATVTPTIDASTIPTSAVVSSGVGVYLRAAPSTSAEQLEWLLDGTIVTLLEGQETADDLVWQQVQVASGAQGWVARDFLVVDGETP